MKVFILTNTGDALGFAHRLTQEQHDVHVYSSGPNLEQHIGLFTNVHSPVEAMKDCKFVLAESGKWPKLQERLKFYNRSVIGISPITELVNDDLVKQYELLTRFDIPTPRSKLFNDLGEVVEGAIEWDAKRTVIRYNKIEMRCDYRDWLAWSLSRIPVGQRVLFQENNIGFEYYLSGWFNGLKWIDLFSISPRENVNSLTSMSHLLPSTNPLVTGTIAKLEPFLRSTEYHGPVNLTLSIQAGKVSVTSATFGFVFPLNYAIFDLIENSIGEFLNAIAFSVDIEPKRTKDYVAVVQAICTEDTLLGAPILGVNDERLKHLVFHNVSQDESDFRLAKGRCIFTAFAHGPTPAECADRVYRTTEAVKFPDKHYDTTMLRSVQPSFAKLHEWKYL